MDIFIATQPIFDINMDVYAYEILYRRGTLNQYDNLNPDEASSKVIIDAFHTIGLERLTGGKPAFINFTDNLINQEIATLFPSGKLVVEVLETVNPNQEIVDKCIELKKRGYTLALDDFVYRPGYEKLIELADIIKVDFISTDHAERMRLAYKFKAQGITILAEKVETQEDFDQAKKSGYSLFQGFFFSKPSILTTKDISPMKFNYLQLINKVNQQDVNFNEIADIIARDVSLSYKLLKLVNSAAFGFRQRIKSVKQATVVLGENELKKWVSLIALKGMGEDKLDELMHMTLIRARFLEAISVRVNMGDQANDLFITGLFSMLDIFMNRPLQELLEELPVAEEVGQALTHKTGRFAGLLQLILAYEKGDWNTILEWTEHFKVSPGHVIQAYLDAVEWYEAITTEKEFT